jgi:ligand-binding sensor protein/sugar diacid utilization regulator/transcriptional regulator with GAF, ATPase, and Fis domain
MAIDVRVQPPSSPRWRLTDLISVEKLQSIQDTFARAFGLPTVILDTEGENATAITHRLRFCEDLTRTSPVSGPRCAECDQCAMRDAAAQTRPAIFRCWNGLYDAAIPIAPKGQVLGYFLCGQVLTEPPEGDAFTATAAEIGVDPGEYVDAVGEVRVIPYEQYAASVESMHALAGMIAEQAAAAIDSLEMLEEARRSKEETALLVEELDTILEALRDISSQPDYQATLDAIADNLARLIPWDSCIIYLAHDDRPDLVPAVVRDPFADQVWRHHPRKGEGMVGKAAMGDAGRRFLDITHEPDFQPIPGVPVEPESALVMPMVYKGTVSGVILLSRFERRTFTDHDLQVLEVFSAQASVAVQVSKLGSENAQRLREERAFGRLRLAVAAPRTTIDGLLGEIAQVGLELLGAETAVVTAPDAGAPAIRSRGTIPDEDVLALLDELTAAVARAGGGDPPVIARGSGSALGLPLGGDPATVAVFARRDGAAWDDRLVQSLAAQASLGIENARMHQREQAVLLRYQRLSELGTQLIAAGDAAAVRARLLERTAEIVSADACFIALLDDGPDAIAVDLRDGARTEERTLTLKGGARVATVRLRGEPTPDRSVFDTWSREVFRAADTDLTSWLAEPLPAPGGALGGLFVAWRSPGVTPSAEQRRILRVLAGAAGTALARFAASTATDSTLRDRLVELEALARLAARVSGAASEGSIVHELLLALRRAGKLRGAVYGSTSAAGVRLIETSGLPRETAARLRVVLEGAELAPEGVRIALGMHGLEVLAIPTPRGDDPGRFVAGVGPIGADEQQSRVMATLARYGSVALENAELHARQRDTIARLHRQHLETGAQYAKLERILSVHDTLALAVLEGFGLASVLRSLGDLMHAEMVVATVDDRVLARWPADGDLEWRPDTSAGSPPRTVISHTGDTDLIAAPVVLDSDVLAWIVARMTAPAGDVERAAVEYGAVLVAVELLRERTALEVENRLRGGLLDELFDESAVPDLVRKRALAFGYELAVPSRVFLVEHVPAPEAGGRPVDPESFHAPAADCAARWSSSNLVAVRGGAVVVVVPERPDPGAGAERRFEDELRAALRQRLPGLAFNGGVGTHCAAFEEYRESYLAARRGLDLLRLLGRRDEVFSFRANTLESMLLQSTRPEVIVGFISRFVEPLAEYDRGHTSDLRRTLEVWLECGQTLEEAARRLHIHVSTLRYRLKKAGEVLGLDLRDSGEALDVQVALRAARVLRVHRG